MAAKDLQSQYHQLQNVDVVTKKTGLAIEFEKVKSLHCVLSMNTALLHCNMRKNHYGCNKNFLPCEYLFSALMMR